MRRAGAKAATTRRAGARAAGGFAVGTFAAVRDAAAVEQILSCAFGLPMEQSRAWVARLDPSGFRIVRAGRAAVGCLTILPMGQWFGGRRVAMAGVAGVAVAPEHRGRGAARHLMRATVEELHRDGYALSALYPATQPLYRDAGYELAGGRYEVRLPVRTIRARDHALAMRPAESADDAAIHAAYRARATVSPGHLDRSAYNWSRVTEPKGDAARGYVVCGARDAVEGYLYLTQKRGESYQYDLNLSDVVTLTPGASRRVLAFLADHGSMANDAIWSGGPADPLLPLLTEQSYSQRLLHTWMIRIVNVTAALTERGYPAGLAGELHLAVRDDLLPSNNGRFVLEIAGGRGAVRPGGSGRLALDVRGLAPLYSGHLTAAALLAAGLLEAPARDVEVATAIFGGPAPSMPDMF